MDNWQSSEHRYNPAARQGSVWDQTVSSERKLVDPVKRIESVDKLLHESHMTFVLDRPGQYPSNWCHNFDNGAVIEEMFLGAWQNCCNRAFEAG